FGRASGGECGGRTGANQIKPWQAEGRGARHARLHSRVSANSLPTTPTQICAHTHTHTHTHTQVSSDGMLMLFISSSVHISLSPSHTPLWSWLLYQCCVCA